MNGNVIGILLIVGIAFVILFIRFLINNLVNKGTDLIANSYRKSKNLRKGPEIVRLADMYPEIAAMHMRNGTAVAANPALMQTFESTQSVAAGTGAGSAMRNAAGAGYAQSVAAGTGAVNATGNAAAGTGAAYGQSVAAGTGNAAAGIGAGYGSQYPVKRQSSGALRVFAYIFMILGLVVNGGALISVIMFFSRQLARYNSKSGFLYYSESFSYIRTVKAALALILITIAAYVVLLVTKKVLYTYFFPILLMVVNVLYIYIFNPILRLFSGYIFRMGGVPRYTIILRFAALFFLILSLAFVVVYVIYVMKGKNFLLYILLGIGLFVAMSGVFIMRRGFRVPNLECMVMCNAFWVALSYLFIALAYKDKNKPLIT